MTTRQLGPKLEFGNFINTRSLATFIRAFDSGYRKLTGRAGRPTGAALTRIEEKAVEAALALERRRRL